MTPKAIRPSSPIWDTLKGGEARLRELLDVVQDLIFHFDAAGRFIDWKAEATDTLIMPPEQFLGKHYSEVLPMTVSQRLTDNIEAARKVKRPQTFEYDIWVPGRGRQDYEARVQITSAGDIFAVCRNITERLRRESDTRNQAFILESICEGVNVVDEQGIIRYTNAAFDAMFGYERGELIGQHVSIVNDLPPSENERFVAEVMEVLIKAHEWHGEFRNRKKDGTSMLTAGSIRRLPLDGQTCWVSTQQDITERRRTEITLRTNKQRLKLALAAAEMGVWEWLPQTNTVFWSPECYTIMGEPNFDGTLDSFTRLLHPEDAQGVMEAAHQAVNSGASFTKEFRIIRPGGVTRWLRNVGRGELDAENKPIRLVGTVQDITDRKLIADRLAASKQRLAALVEHGYAGVNILDLEGLILYHSPANQQLLGFEPAAVLGTSYLTHVHPEDLVAFKISWAECVRRRSRVSFNPFRVRNSKKEWRWIEANAVNLIDTPAVQGIVLNWQDITERKQAMDALLDSEKQLRQLTETLQDENTRFTQVVTAAPGAICAFQRWPDDSTTMPYASPGLYELYGLRPEEVTHDVTPILSGLHPDDREKVKHDILESARTMSLWHSEFRYYHPIKGMIWVEVRSTPSRQPDGSVLWYGILTDVTLRRKAEGELRRTAELLKAVADGTTDAIFVKSREGKYLFCNEAAARYIGRPMAEVVGKDDSELLDGQSARQVMSHDRSVMVTGKVLTAEEQISADGNTLTFLATKAPYLDARGNTIGTIGVSRDISERKVTERQLAESEERYRTLVEFLPESIFIFSHDQLVFCNSAFVQLMGGTDAQEFIGRSPFEFLHPKHHEAVWRRIQDLFAEGKPAPPRESEFFRQDGTLVAASVTAAPISYRGQLSGLVVLHDLTEMKRSTGLLQSVMQSVIDAIVTIDEQGVIHSINPAVERLFGYDSAELVGQNIKILMPEPYCHEHDGYLADYLRTGVAKVIGIGREVEGRRKDGSTFPAELEITAFILDNVRHFTGVIRDITERKALESQIRQAQKMEAIGLLAGGVAHDFNNLLCVINGFSDLLLQQISPHAPEHGPLTQIRSAGKRAADLTNQLLTFGRKAMIELKVLDLNEIVSHAETMLIRLIGEDIVLSTELEPNLCLVKVDRSQFEQVILNLVINARDALPQGGTINVATRNVELKPGQINCQPDLKPGRYAELSVSDNGLGMTDEVKGKIFDPFFTTKGMNKGTGLGLAVVHGIVSQSNGRIEVVTKIGAGTTFRILLPAAPAPASAQSGAASALSPPPGQETILLVEDESAVLGIARRSLQTYGYKVLTASSGRDALILLDRERQPIDLLVTDVVMPEMTGRQLADMVLSQFPSIPVLFLSGYAADEVIRRGIMEADVEFLQKPFTPRSLARKVREVLDRAARGEEK